MNLSVHIYLIFLTFIAATSSKNIRIKGDENIETTPDSRLTTISANFPLTEEPEFDAKLNPKRGVLILMPVEKGRRERRSDKCEEELRVCQKTKRCKDRGREAFLGSKHVIKSPHLRLLSLKNTNPMKKDSLANKESEADRNEKIALVNAIREKLKSKDSNVDVAQKNLLYKTNIIDDDKYICYCREKSNPSARKETISKLHWLTRKNKVDKKDDNRKILPKENRRQKPIYENAQRRPFLHDRLPALYSDIPRYSNPLSRKMTPIPQQPYEGIEKLPYVPYVYHLNPELPIIPDTILGEKPTKINIPFNSVVKTADSLVGQPIGQPRDFNERRQNDRNSASSKSIDEIVSSVQKIPVTSKAPVANSVLKGNDLDDYSAKINTESSKVNNHEAEGSSDSSDYNLQAVHSEFLENATQKSVEDSKVASESISVDKADSVTESFNEEREGSSQVPLLKKGLDESSNNDVGTANPQMENEYETTGNGAVDYSEVREVTASYFTTREHSSEADETNAHFDDDGLLATADYSTSISPLSVDQTNEENLQSPSDVNMEIPNVFTTEITPERDIMNTNKQDSGNVGSEDEAFVDPAENRINTVVGESNPTWHQPANTNDNLNTGYDAAIPEENEHKYDLNEPFPMEETTLRAYESLTTYDEGVSKNSDAENGPSSVESPAGDYWADSPKTDNKAGPSEGNYEDENFGTDYGIGNEEKKEEEGNVVGVPAAVNSAESVSNYPAINMDFANQGNEDRENEPSLVESTDKSTNVDETKNSLPFCDNTFLQKSIKAVINNFATGDSSEMNEETVSSTGNELMEEIVQVPNLRSIVSMPPIERTIVDKVKTLLTKLTNIPRHSLDSDWATNIIKDNLRHMMAAAPVSKQELPPMAVEEHQFKNGKWTTHLVTLEPTNEENDPSDLDRLQASVKNLIRDPAVGLQAAKQPAVQNMIVQSVQNTFQPENQTNNEIFNESVIQGTLDKELKLMEMEEIEDATTKNADEEELSVANIDMTKLLEIAKEEAGIDESSTLKLPTINTSEKSLSKNRQSESGKQEEQVGNPRANTESLEKEVTNSEETLAKTTSTKLQESFDFSTAEPLNYDIIAATRSFLPSQYIELSSTETATYATEKTNPVTVIFSNGTPEREEVEVQELETTTATTKEVSETTENKSFLTESLSNIVPTTSSNEDESLTELKQDDLFVKDNVPTTRPTKSYESEVESSELIGLTRGLSSSTEAVLGAKSPQHDFTYLGKISLKNNNPTNDVCSLEDSELYYVGDGVKLPLEIRKLNDGSFALSISRKVCEHLLNKECPCCVPTKGNVVRTVRRNSERRRRKRISKRESLKSIFSNKRRNSADDGLQIFSMPVETFARRYNLSLNLEKLQAPWNFEAKKIDDRSWNRKKNLENKADNADVSLLQDLLSVHEILDKDNSKTSVTRKGDTNYRPQTLKQESQKIENTRYQRNTDENVNKRMELIKNMLHLLREMILRRATGR